MHTYNFNVHEYIRYTFPDVEIKFYLLISNLVSQIFLETRIKMNYGTNPSRKSTSYLFYLAHINNFFKHIIKENSYCVLRPIFSLQ